MQLQRIYNDYYYIFTKIIESARFRNQINISNDYITNIQCIDDNEYNISVLFAFNNLKMIKFWLRKV